MERGRQRIVSVDGFLDASVSVCIRIKICAAVARPQDPAEVHLFGQEPLWERADLKSGGRHH